MADTDQVRSKSRDALLKALERGATKEGVPIQPGHVPVCSSLSVLAQRIEAAMFEYYGRDLSMEHARPMATGDEPTTAETLVTHHGDLVATEAYRQAVRAHVTTLTSYNTKLAALLIDGDLSPDTFATMNSSDMMTDSMQKKAEQTKKQFIEAERGYLPNQSDFVTPAQAGWDLEGQNRLDVDPITGEYGR